MRLSRALTRRTDPRCRGLAFAHEADRTEIHKYFIGTGNAEIGRKFGQSSHDKRVAEAERFDEGEATLRVARILVLRTDDVHFEIDVLARDRARG